MTDAPRTPNRGAEGALSVRHGTRLGVRELRVVVTAADYDEAVRFYRDVLGLPERAAFASEGGRVSILEAGCATLEIADPPHAEFIDAVEVGQRVAGQIRIAFEVADVEHATAVAMDADAELIAPPTRTPWNSLNSRLTAPAGLQLTLFQELSGCCWSERRDRGSTS